MAAAKNISRLWRAPTRRCPAPEKTSPGRPIPNRSPSSPPSPAPSPICTEIPSSSPAISTSPPPAKASATSTTTSVCTSSLSTPPPASRASSPPAITTSIPSTGRPTAPASPATGEITRLTATESAEYRPHYSPDGKTIAYEATRRGLTDRETTMEDTHVWLADSNGTNRRDIGLIDNRQGDPGWSSDGRFVYFTVQDRGSVHLYRVASSGGRPEPVISDRASVGAWSVAGDKLAYALSTPGDLAELYLKTAGGEPRKLTDLNREILAGKTVEPVESFTFLSNDNKWTVEAFLTYPAHFRPDGKYPLIVNIHGGPHGQQGPAFNFKNQVYSSRGWATLMVNYRGSTGYGQAFADAVFGDQNGNEGQDVLYGVSAAIRRYLWIDRDRLGIEGTSYGGQLSAWLITQTNIFKAAIPTAAITNLISYNYMTYYNQYEAMEWGAYPHQGNLMDVLWERSALKHVAQAHTPTMLVHGENDPDVPIAEAEQYYIALRDVGVPAIMVRYPREGHGIAEPRHQVDFLDRSIAWYEKYFPK